MNKISAAHKLYPMNTILKVTNLDNNKSLKLRINDRGPYKYKRAIDLSKRAAQKLQFYRKGTAHVKIEVLGYAIKKK